MISFGNVPAGSVLPIPFDTFASATGASITITGLAVTDIEVYKGTSMTQRASDAGYTLMDTDGIDLDGITGIQGFSIDLGDDTDAGFYTAGSFFWVVVSAITIDGQTVSFVAATWRIVVADNTAGTPVVDIGRISNDATAADNLETACDGGSFNLGGGGVVAASVTGAVGSVTGAVGSVTGAVGSVTGNVGGNVVGSVGSVTAGVTVAAGGFPVGGFAAGAINADACATDFIGAAELSSAAATKIANALFDQADGIETGYTFRESQRVVLASQAGRTSGAGTGTFTIRDITNTRNCIVGTVDLAGNRDDVVIDAVP